MYVIHIYNNIKDNKKTQKTNSIKKKPLLIKFFAVLDMIAVIAICGYLFIGSIYDEKNTINASVTKSANQASAIIIISNPATEKELSEEISAKIGGEAKNLAKSADTINELKQADTTEFMQPLVTPFYFVLEEGDTGDRVIDLQIKLYNIGLYKGKIDGSYKKVTRSAVIKFQELYNLFPNGIVDDETWAALEDVLQAASAEELRINTKLLANFLVLKEGDISDNVKNLQIKLHDIGLYAGNIDGSFQTITKSAVMKLQQLYNLVSDGIVDSKTWGALEDALKSVNIEKSYNAVNSLTNIVILKEGSIGDSVKDLQIKLHDIGLYAGNIDGSFQTITKSAVVKLQQLYNLVPNGIVDGKTWDALEDALKSADEKGSQAAVQPPNEKPSDIEDIERYENVNPEPVGINGLEITFKFGDDIILERIKDESSENNGREVFSLPVTVKNLKSEPDRLSNMEITRYGVGKKLDDISGYFDDICNIDINGEETVSGYMYFLYEGKGIYSVEFEHNGKKYEVPFSLGDTKEPESSYTLTLD